MQRAQLDVDDVATSEAIGLVTTISEVLESSAKTLIATGLRTHRTKVKFDFTVRMPPILKWLLQWGMQLTPWDPQHNALAVKTYTHSLSYTQT